MAMVMWRSAVLVAKVVCADVKTMPLEVAGTVDGVPEPPPTPITPTTRAITATSATPTPTHRAGRPSVDLPPDVPAGNSVSPSMVRNLAPKSGSGDADGSAGSA